MGRASNRKKAQRQAGPGSRQSSRGSTPPPPLVVSLDALVEVARVRAERAVSVRRRAWYGDAEPVPAQAPPWPEGSLGDRFLTGTYLGEAKDAPSLLTVQIPDAAVITADPEHWTIAANALVRAVIFDGLEPYHPAVRTLLGILAPIAQAEFAYGEAMDAWLNRGGLNWHDAEPEFPELDGPVFLLGATALVEAVWAAVGDDPLGEIIAVLRPELEAAIPGLDGEVVVDALIGAFAEEYRCEQPGDAEVLQRIGHPGGNPLETLVAAGTVPPADVLPFGLTVLSALAQLCQSGSASLLQPAA